MYLNFPHRIGCLIVSLALAVISHGPVLAQSAGVPPGAAPVSPTAGSAPSLAPDPCIDCDALYAVDCGTGLWEIDLATGWSKLIGHMPETMDDIAISADGRLFGVAMGSGVVGTLYEISACDASATVVGVLSANGLTGDTSTTDLFAQGPPLWRVETTGLYPVTTIGGQIGSGLPFWCGVSSGDLALNPADGLLYSVLARCSVCPFDDRVVKIDPATGDVVEELVCLPGPMTVIIDRVDGLAFDSQGRLWGAQAWDRQQIFQVNPVTGIISVSLPLNGGLDCIRGLAACPGPLLPSGPVCDIKPGSDTNPINPRSRGVIPVAILGSPTFDVMDIDPSTVTFGPDGATPAHSVGIHFDDVDLDGYIDAVFHFRTQETGIVQGDDEACISWMDFAGNPFSCCDPIHTVPAGVLSNSSERNPAITSPGCGGMAVPAGPGAILGSLLPWMAVLVILVAISLARRWRPA